MRKNLFYLILYVVLVCSCSYKPLYTKKNFGLNKIDIIIKSKGKYDNNVVLMKNILEKKFNFKASKPSNLKLVISLDRIVSNLGVNKDLNTFGKRVTIIVNYALYDKKGSLTKGNLTNSSTFNFSANDYANINSLEDSFSKLVRHASENIGTLVLAESFSRKVYP